MTRWILILAILLAGCGGGDDPAPIDPGTGGGGSGGDGSGGGGSGSGGGGSGGGGETVSFAVDLQPILTASCGFCHGGAGGLSLDSHAGVMAGGNSGAIVVAGDPDTSLLIERVTVDDPPFKPLMPADPAIPPLTDAQVEFFRTWILEGAKDN
ncbi:MAG: c-type cytochrome domain-containing protein [Planctomycetota bacterium]|jgi:hypothetical protein